MIRKKRDIVTSISSSISYNRSNHVRLYEDKHVHIDNKTKDSSSTNNKKIENRFIRSRDDNNIKNVHVDRSDQSSISTTNNNISSNNRYTIHRNVLNRERHNRNNNTEEINKKLDILKMNANSNTRQLKDTEIFNKSKDDTDHEVGPEPDDIDDIEGDGRSNNSVNKHDVYNDIGKFENRFDNY